MRSLTQRHALISPFDDYEIRLVRLVLDQPGAIHPRDEAALRYALSLARLVALRLPNGTDFDTLALTTELRERLSTFLAPIFSKRPIDTAALTRAVGPICLATKATRAKLIVALAGKATPQHLENELTHRSLVLALGGGGGCGYAHLGALSLLESAGLRPQLITGASMGAIIGLFRARLARFDVSQVPQIMGELHHRHVFRPYRGENRYTLPSPIRLALRDGIGPYFEFDGVPLRLRDLPIPLLVTVAGIRRDVLTQNLTHYRGITSRHAGTANFGLALTRDLVKNVLPIVSELIRMPELLRNVVLGADDVTRDFDVVDAVGFSSSVPGALHYDFARDAPTEIERLETLMNDADLLRLTDGGVVDNVPARTAWRAVQRGIIGTRNVFVVALDGFSPRITTPLWLPLQRIAYENVRRSRPYAHFFHAFQRTLSPVELIPRTQAVMRNIESSKEELIDDLPFIQRMMEPLPGSAALLAA